MTITTQNHDNRITQPGESLDAFERLQQTATFRGDGMKRWKQATIGVAGAGNLGSHFAIEAVQSGVSVRIFDPDVGERHNTATQRVRPGIPKVESIVNTCNSIRPGKAVGVQSDIQHVGVGEMDGLDVLVDCTDDGSLAMPLTRVSNGLRIPMLRLAVNGDGTQDIGRVQCSHGGAAATSCQICTFSLDDLFRDTARASCFDAQRPTLAGGALGAVIAGAGLLQAQRLVTGNDLDQVIDREIIFDLSHWQLLPIRRTRSEKCLSGHERWEFTKLDRQASETTLFDLFDEAQQRLRATNVVIQPFCHPLCIGASCRCGRRALAIGTQWAKPPTCRACAAPMQWFTVGACSQLTDETVKHLEIEQASLVELGFPRRGALFAAAAEGTPPLQMLLL